MFGYFAQLKMPKLILWCYLAWYLAIVSQYFDAAASLWISSLGITAIIGFALTLATQEQGTRPNRWVIFRLYLFPFCVSSYSALIKGKGFILLFPSELHALVWGIAACCMVVIAHLICRHLLCPALGGRIGDHA
ncbi:MAG: hypothetical protein ACI8Z5_001526 [Lentimonas sp.]|jgi:hypothetical protein